MGHDYFTPIISKVVSFALVPALWYHFLMLGFCMLEQGELFPYGEAVHTGKLFIEFFIVSSICNVVVYLTYYFCDK